MTGAGIQYNWQGKEMKWYKLMRKLLNKINTTCFRKVKMSSTHYDVHTMCVQTKFSVHAKYVHTESDVHIYTKYVPVHTKSEVHIYTKYVPVHTESEVHI